MAHFIKRQHGFIHVKWLRNTQILQKKKKNDTFTLEKDLRFVCGSGRESAVARRVSVKWWKGGHLRLEGRREAVTPGGDQCDSTRREKRSQVEGCGACVFR